MSLRVTDKELVADEVVRLTLADPDGRPLPLWAPGAHIDLRLTTDLVRQYSLCGDPDEHTEFQISVLREPEGRGGSVSVHDELQVGQRVDVVGPRNNFPLVPGRRFVFIAGGVGITPFLPMIRSVEAARADWFLVYGGRSRSSMAFAQELSLTHTHHVLLRPQDEYGLLDIRAALGEPDQTTAIYACGPEPLLAAVERTCVDWPDGALHLERFAARPTPPATPNSSFDVELARSGRTVSVNEETSVLRAVTRSGVMVPSSCEGGICGSCEVAVLSGEIDHRDAVLNETERSEGRSMMVCVSRAKSNRLVLDL